MMAAYVPVPTPPYAHHLNTTMQVVATFLLWGATAVTLGWAASIARKERTLFPVLLILAVGAGSILEPIYDITFHLLWYTGGTQHGDITGHQWTLFTAFGLPQPVWVMPAYIMVFGLPALIMYRRFRAGATMQLVWKQFGVLFLTTAVFETTANNIDLYGYYGEAPLRLLKYPVWIAAMESCQITGLTILAAVLSRRMTKERHAYALFALFPANFAFDVIGAGFPTLIAMNMGVHPNKPILWLTAVLSVGLSVTALWWTSQLLLWDQRRHSDAVVDAGLVLDRDLTVAV